jgi:hypothetical protein
VVIGFLLLVSLVVSAAVSYMGAHWFSEAAAVARVLELVGSLIVMSALFALTFKILPSRRIPWGRRDRRRGRDRRALLDRQYTSSALYIGQEAPWRRTSGRRAPWWSRSCGSTTRRRSSSSARSSRAPIRWPTDRKAWSRRRTPNTAPPRAAMVARAEDIVKGRDPVLLKSVT